MQGIKNVGNERTEPAKGFSEAPPANSLFLRIGQNWVNEFLTCKKSWEIGNGIVMVVSAPL